MTTHHAKHKDSVNIDSPDKGMSHDELISLVQDGKMSSVQYVMTSEHKHSFIDWLLDNKMEPSDFTADIFLNELEKDFLRSQIFPETIQL